MTAQFHVAYSDRLVGAGIIAGGPFYCVGSYETDPEQFFEQATSTCMNPLTESVGPDGKGLFKKAQKLASANKIADKIITLYPTFVLGGDENKPYSHIYGGLPDVLKYIGLVRWFQADGSFHFIHAKDIAQVVNYLIENPAPESKIVLGNQRTTANQAVEEICTYLNKKIYFRIPLSLTIANFFIKVFNLQMEAWSRVIRLTGYAYSHPIPMRRGSGTGLCAFAQCATIT